MYKIAESNCDFAIISDRSVCQACLSSDRKLSSIGEFVDIFMNICNTSHNMKSQAYLCWECMAILKKIKLFKTQVENAQKILRNQLINKQKPILTKSLSKLTKSNTENIIISIIHNEDDNLKKEDLNIKQENDHSDDDFDCDQNEDISVKEQGKETENVTRKKYISTKRMSQYRILSDSTAMKVVRKKFSIKHDDPKIWLERERNTEFYKSFTYKCDMCVRGFDCEKKLEKHLLSHDKVVRKKFSIKHDDPKIWLERERNTEFYKSFTYKCDMCVRGFDCEKKLEKHLLSHDKSSGRHICPTCTMRFSRESSLHTHMRAHKFGWQCLRCDFRCYSSQRLSAHIKTHNVVQCAHCDAQLPDVSTFYLHYKALHSIFLCDYCGKRCKTKYLIEKHIKIHHMDTHTCATCARCYNSLSALRKHIAATHATARAYCVACDKHYRSRALYRRHVLTSRAHGHERDAQTTKTYPCPECSNTYSRRAFMMNHYRHVHTNQSKHHCEHCDKRFLNRTKYVDHMRYYHEGVKREKNKLCTVCGKGFAATRTLSNHMRTHTGERPYECSYCTAKFTQHTSLVSHVRYIHMKNKRPAR